MFDVYFHSGPIIRLLEFYMGMLLIPIYFYINDFMNKYKNQLWVKIMFTFIQIIFPLFIYLIMLKYNYLLFRCYFVLIFCFSIFIISYDYGFLSDLFASKLFAKIMSCQIEMYLLQRTINNILLKIIGRKKFESIFNKEMQFLIKLFFIFIFGYFYKILFREKFAKLFDIFLIKLKVLILN